MNIPYRKASMKLTREIESARKCPFCSTVNSASRINCRNCGHKYPFPLQKDKFATNRKFHMILSDPRDSTQKSMEVVLKVVPGLFVLVIPLLEDHVKGETWIYPVAGAVVILAVTAVIYLRRSHVNVERVCQNCGQAMILRIPFNRSKFPSSVKCWNCGAVHEIDWIDSSDRNRVISVNN
jgi:predicted RNA-binding Zn-ribbon protein involved in translation (DUF1610 family)